MAKTIAELRRKAIGELAKRHSNYLDNTYEVIEEATKVMNAFYRYAGFAIRKFYFENDGRRYNERTAARLEKENNRRMAKISDYLKAFNADIHFNGVYPSIIDRASGHSYPIDLYLTYWYN